MKKEKAKVEEIQVGDIIYFDAIDQDFICTSEVDIILYGTDIIVIVDDIEMCNEYYTIFCNGGFVVRLKSNDLVYKIGHYSNLING